VFIPEQTTASSSRAEPEQNRDAERSNARAGNTETLTAQMLATATVGEG
jgi:hypothetical protein